MANTKLPARLLDDSVIPAAYISGTLAVDTNTLRVDSTNNRVGIGITSPSVKLHVRGSAVSGATFNADDGLTIEQAGGGGSNINLISSTNTGVLFSDAAARAVGLLNYSHSDNSMRFNTNGSEAMRIDSSGNVGIGVTPYTIYSGWTGLDIGSGGITSITSGNENITLSSNAYLNSSGAWAYKTTNEASSYLQSAGTHYWRTAASGSANAAITWNNAMFMNASGNIGIGTTNPLAALSVGSGSLTDGALPIQISTGADGTQSYFAVNRNGAYGALFGYSASSTYKGLIIRNVVSSGTANADGISLMTDNTQIRMHITGAGNVGIGNTNPGYPLDVTSNSSALGIRIRGRSDHIGELNFASNNGATVYSQIQSLSSELRVKAISNIPMTFFTNNTKRMTLTENGDLGITGTAAVSVTQKATATVTDTQSTGGSYNWTFSTNTGTNNDIGSLDVAGIRNRHVFRWAMSGSMTANTWYPFAKRSEIAAAGPDGGSNANDGFAMYFRVYLYPTLSGWGEYLSSRVSNMCWIANYGSNSTQEQEFVMGPALGHAPNAGQNVDTATSNPVRLRIHHRMGNESNIGANQTFELLLTQSLTGLNPAVNGRLVYIYGYVL